MRLRLCALALASMLACPAAAGPWELEHGVCTEQWTRGHVLRGPTAITNGLLRPLTSFAGGVWFAAAECHHRPRCLWAGPLWVLGSTGWGFAQGLYWVGTGLLDTPTFGAKLFSPYEASRLQWFPVVPFVESHPLNDDERCT